MNDNAILTEKEKEYNRADLFSDYLKLKSETQSVEHNPVTYKLTQVDRYGNVYDTYFHDWEYMIKRLSRMLAELQNESVLQCDKSFSIEIIVGERAKTEDDSKFLQKRMELKKFLKEEDKKKESEIDFLNERVVKEIISY
jgi:hypothetical protein